MRRALSLLLLALLLPITSYATTFVLEDVVFSDRVTFPGNPDDFPRRTSIDFSGRFTVEDNAITAWDISIAEGLRNHCTLLCAPLSRGKITAPDAIEFDLQFGITPTPGGLLNLFLFLDRPLADGAQILPTSHVLARGLLDGDVQILSGHLAAVPEPQTVVALLGGVVLLSLRLSRRASAGT